MRIVQEKSRLEERTMGWDRGYLGRYRQLLDWEVPTETRITLTGFDTNDTAFERGALHSGFGTILSGH